MTDAPNAIESPEATVQEAATPPARKQHGFVRAAAVVGVLTLVSRITGLIRDSVQARVLGQEAVADSFAYGFQVPHLFRRLFGEGALTAAFIPVYSDLLAKDHALARRFAWLCLVLMTLVLGGLIVLGELALWSLWHGYVTSPDTALTIRLTMIMLPYTVLVCLVAMFGTILQVHGRFAPSAAQPILLNVVMVVSMVWLAWGAKTDSALAKVVPWIAWGVICAGVWQCLSQGMILLKYAPPTLRFHGTFPAFKIMLATWLPMLIALSVFQVNTFVDSNLAYFLSPKQGGPAELHWWGYSAAYPIDQGGLAALFRSQLLYQFPLGVFGIAIATAVFPALAHAAAQEGAAGREHFASILRHGLRLTVFIGLPASVGLLLVRVPVCRVLFEGSKFTIHDSVRCANIVAAYAPAIWAYSMTHVLTRAFYARKDSRTPMRVSVQMVLLNFLLNITLVWFLGAAGLAAATALCAIIQCLILLRLTHRYIDRPIDRAVWRGWAKTAVLAGLLAAALAPVVYFFDPARLSKRMVLVELIVMLTLGTGIFLAGAWLLGCQEIAWLRRKKGDIHNYH